MLYSKLNLNSPSRQIVGWKICPSPAPSIPFFYKTNARCVFQNVEWKKMVVRFSPILCNFEFWGFRCHPWCHMPDVSVRMNFSFEKHPIITHCNALQEMKKREIPLLWDRVRLSFESLSWIVCTCKVAWINNVWAEKSSSLFYFKV